jgi:predicted acyltransferase
MIHATKANLAPERGKAASPAGGRLLSIDFFRGLTMFILIGSSTGLYKIMRSSPHPVIAAIGDQFEHAAWSGMHFWDLVEPFFMFIVGVAIPFSVMKRLERGDSWKSIAIHAVQRSVILFLLGIAYYSVSAGRPVFKLWNILTQLSFTYLIAFLLIRKPIRVQLAWSFVLIIAYELLFRLWPVAGFNQPFVVDHNFGSWFDMTVMGRLDSDHWVSSNFISMAAFTIWGGVAGLVMRGGRTAGRKTAILALAGIAGVLLGFAVMPFTPFIKRIGTSSFVLEAGGWCFLALALSYWLIDIRKWQKVPVFFAIVGMNPLFIYLFEQVGGSSFLAHLTRPFVHAAFFWTPSFLPVATSLVTWALLWYLCYWLYKHHILIKI